MTDNEETMDELQEKRVPEPSVLDYLKSRLMPWKGIKIEIPAADAAEGDGIVLEPVLGERGGLPAMALEETVGRSGVEISPPARVAVPEGDAHAPTAETTPAAADALPVFSTWPWRSMGAVFFALVAEVTFEPPVRDAYPGVLFYLIAVILMVWAIFTNEWKLPALPRPERKPFAPSTRAYILLFILPLLAFLYLNFRDNLFTAFNVWVWVGTIVFTLAALWVRGEFINAVPWWSRLRLWVTRQNWTFQITQWQVAVVASTALVAFFMLYRLDDVAPEMNSDHAEKLMDVYDILQGQFSIFFHRNTGREPLYIYLSAWVAKNLGTGISFLTLKIAAAIGLALTLPFIYLLGKEIANRRVGLIAFLFAGIGYWPIVQARFALRITFYPLFVAPTLYFFIRGLKRSNRNDFLLSGIFLGLGLMGYTPFRIVPIMLLILFAVYLLHRHAANVRGQTIWAFGLLVITSFVAAMPLLSYAVQNPEGFAYRAFSRIGPTEVPLSDSPIVLFFQNLANAAKMFNWYDGEIWVHSVPGRPALDVVTGVLFVLGVTGVLVRYIRNRHWIDILLLLSVPLLMMPSILSLAFPNENPALNRTVGAIVPVFILVAIGLEGFLTTLRVRFGGVWGRRAAAFTMILFVLWSANHNFDLIFNQYARFYRLNAWNTTEMGEVIESFGVAVGDPDQAYVVPFPHWIDTRLVSMTAGLEPRDFAIFRDRIPDTVAFPGPKLFLVNLQDLETLIVLNEIYPQGAVQTYTSSVPNKDFLIYLVVPNE